MKKLLVLLLTLVLGVSAFASVGILDLDALLVNYQGYTDARALAAEKEKEVLGFYPELYKGVGLNSEDLLEFRMLKVKLAPSQLQQSRAAELEAKSNGVISKLNEISAASSRRDLTAEETAYLKENTDLYNKNRDTLNKEVQARQAALVTYTRALESAIQTELDAALKKVATDKKLTMIVKKSISGGEQLVLWSDPAGDVTTDVKNIMVNSYKKTMFDSIKFELPAATE